MFINIIFGGWISSQAENLCLSKSHSFAAADAADDADAAADDNDGDEEDGCLVGQKICVFAQIRDLFSEFKGS